MTALLSFLQQTSLSSTNQNYMTTAYYSHCPCVHYYREHSTATLVMPTAIDSLTQQKQIYKISVKLFCLYRLLILCLSCHTNTSLCTNSLFANVCSILRTFFLYSWEEDRRPKIRAIALTPCRHKPM